MIAKSESHLPMISFTRHLVACAALVVSIAATVSAAPARPNIVFIMTDDHATAAISAYGSRVNHTPHLDRLANEGMRFDRVFCVNAICTPSRAVIMTGQYSHLNGVPVFNSIDGSRPNVAKYLQAAGYRTGMIGKWHLGSQPTGFDEWMILPGQGDYFDPTFISPAGRKVIKGYATDVITDLAMDFIAKSPKDKPFFLMYHHKAPHRNWSPHPKHQAQFADKYILEPDTLRDNHATRTDAIRECEQKVFTDLTRKDLKLVPPANLATPVEKRAWLAVKPTEVEIEINGRKQILTGAALDSWKYQRYMQDYLACVQSVDDNMGRFLDFLDQQNLATNTIVIYTSDQGFFLGEHGLYDKRFMYEETLRMPFIVRWPAVIKPGQVQDGMANNTDFAPTFLDAAGAAVPVEMQGRSLLPLLKGERPADWRRSVYYRYYHDPGHHNTRAHYGVRTETHKLIHFWKSGQWEMYDLVKDPAEMRNIYNDQSQQKVVAELKAELFRLKKELKDDDQFADKLPFDDVDTADSSAKEAKPAAAKGAVKL
jgi:arylsulfatase A-like enzyme